MESIDDLEQHPRRQIVVGKVKESTSSSAAAIDPPAAPEICGIVMPISAIDNCSEGHWAEVLSIITDAVASVGFEANVVSNADDVGIIQKRIIQNLYDNPIVVCDVSGKNPNVMFELGLRLAFDKPTIIIKDDKTDYSFDTAPIEHIEYPRDLRFTKIVEFKKKLAEKVQATVKASANEKGYTTFLKHFGEFKVAHIDKKEVSPQEFLVEEVAELKKSIRRLDSSIRRNADSGPSKRLSGRIDLCLASLSTKQAEVFADLVAAYPGTTAVSLVKFKDHHHLRAVVENDLPGEFERIETALVQMLREYEEMSWRSSAGRK